MWRVGKQVEERNMYRAWACTMKGQNAGTDCSSSRSHEPGAALKGNDCVASLSSSSLYPRIDNDLGYIILLISPDFIHRWCLIQSNAMRDDIAWINLPFLNALQ